MSTIKEESADERNVCETSTNNNNNSVNNRFANDGSFMQMFMNMQRQMQQQPQQQQQQQQPHNSCGHSNDANDNETVSDCNQNTDVSSSTDNQTISGETSSIATTTTTATNSSAVITSSKPSSTVSALTGKRRIKKTLKVGVIKKQRPDTTGGEDTDDTRNNAWARYMNEVRKYKEKFGDDGDKNRPLVK